MRKLAPALIGLAVAKAFMSAARRGAGAGDETGGGLVRRPGCGVRPSLGTPRRLRASLVTPGLGARGRG